MRRDAGAVSTASLSGLRPLAWARRWRSVEPGGPRASSRASDPSSTATSTASATSTFVTEASANSRSQGPCAIKLMTALIAAQHLGPADSIPISPVAEGMPARKINVKASQAWTFDSLMRSMMMVSANDAAVALAEKVGGGSLDGYVDVANKT